jgi:PIN domain nuclease of toxin-antitoxin system
VWEISIKQAAGKLKAPPELLDELARIGFARLPITWEHAFEAGTLPRHHGDPFDRMLVAQARVEDLTLVTRDLVFARYGVPVLPA